GSYPGPRRNGSLVRRLRKTVHVYNKKLRIYIINHLDVSMSKPQVNKHCDIFTRARTNTPKTTSNILSASKEAKVSEDRMAQGAEVLSELKSLRADFGVKLDNMTSRLTDMANSMAALESKMAEVKGDVAANTARIDEAERRVGDAEDALEAVNSILNSAIKRIAFLVSKTEDLEKRGRRKNLRVLGVREGAEGKESLLDLINNMLPRWLELSPGKTFTLERVHRTFPPARPNQSRAILIRFLKFQEKEYVYREARRQGITHEGAKLMFVQDL
ncbi:hypothetical protein AOLI_G00109040, partial [Acnodon oligacanthus]